MMAFSSLFSASAAAGSGVSSLFRRYLLGSAAAASRSSLSSWWQLFTTTDDVVGGDSSLSRRPPRPPLMMLSSPNNPQTRYFYQVEVLRDEKEEEEDTLVVDSTLKLKREMKLPEIAGHHCIGSSQGFLVTIDVSKSTDIHITHPFTGFHLSLPPPSFCFDGINRKLEAPRPPTGSETIQLDSQYKILYRSKALISPCLDRIILLRPDSVDTGGGLVVASLHLPTSCDRVRVLYQSFRYRPGIKDAIFHKGRLHVLSGLPPYRSLVIYDDSVDKLNVAPTVLRLQPTTLPLYPEPCYLVESPDGHQLFLVSREMDIDDESAIDADIDDHVDRDEDSPILSTRFFYVSRVELDMEKQLFRLVRVDSLGDLAIFVGHGHCTCISVGGGGGDLLKPNRIYFTDHLVNNHICGDSERRMFYVKEVGDTGVFNMEDGSIYLHNLTRGGDDGGEGDEEEALTWPMPVWYTPST